MELLSLEIILSFTLLFISSLEVCRAVDCGGSKISSTIVVDQSNKANFRTIQAAIDSIKPNNAQWVKIQINAGVYKEKVQIPTEKPCIFLQGQGKQVTTITNNDHNAPNTSSTFTAFANNLAASEITFKNSYGIIQRLNMHRNERHFGIRDPSLAARISGDKCAFYNCNFIGFQDTVWDERGRHYFQNCLFEGAVDFIFGAGQSFYQDCVLNATALGSITAQGRASTSDQSGFVFEGGSVVGSGVGNSLLGRAYRSCSRVIFHKTALAPVVEPVGWDAWNYTNKVECIFFSEVECTGPGANTSERVTWAKKLTPTAFAQNFSLSAFVNQDGWLSQIPQK